MAERKDQAKGAAHKSTDDVNASMLQDAMADFLKSNMVRIQGADHFMQIISTGVFNDSKPFFPEEDLSYSDVSDYDDDEDDYFQQQKAAHQSKEFQTTKSTDEKDDKDEIKAEEERSKEKKQKNKRKKTRRKEKKQSEKENTVNLPEEEPGNSDSSENPEENPSTDNNTEANKSPECDKTQNETKAAGDEERSVVNNREENLATINKKEEVKEDEKEKEFDSNNSYAVKSMPEETCNQKPAQEMQGISRLVEVLQLEEEEPKVVEEEPKVVENPEVPKEKEKRNEPNEEQLQKENVQQKTTDTAAEEYAKISRELAGTGNRFAASGMFEKAIECFTDAIKFNPREYRLFGNRSLCYERMQQFENALRDADLSLSMEPNWIKGLFRKGKALCGLKKYYEAFLVYDKVLQLDGSSAEAKQESKRAQTLYLMGLGYSWAESNEALKDHATLLAAAAALHDAHNPIQGTGYSVYDADVIWLQAEDGKEAQANHSGAQRVKVPARTSSPLQNRSQSHSPTPHPRNYPKPQLYSVWVGALAPTVTYDSLHELFSRVGEIYSIKIMLEHECAFVNYTRQDDCELAIESFDGMGFEGLVIHVRYSFKGQSSGMGKKECFFWRTSGCTRQDCTFRHVPDNKNIDRKKFNSRLGFNNM